MLLDELAGAPPVKTIWFDSVKDISWPPHAAVYICEQDDPNDYYYFYIFYFLGACGRRRGGHFARGKIYATL